jgi:hypothetical protein
MMMGTYFFGGGGWRWECRAAGFLHGIVRVSAALLYYCFKLTNTFGLSENVNNYVQVELERKSHIFVFAVCVDEGPLQLTVFKTLTTLS